MSANLGPLLKYFQTTELARDLIPDIRNGKSTKMSSNTYLYTHFLLWIVSEDRSHVYENMRNTVYHRTDTKSEVILQIISLANKLSVNMVRG